MVGPGRWPGRSMDPGSHADFERRPHDQVNETEMRPSRPKSSAKDEPSAQDPCEVRMDTAATTRRFASEWQAEPPSRRRYCGPRRGPPDPFHRDTGGRGWRAPRCLPCEAFSRSRVGAVQETLEASFVPDGLFLADDLGSPMIPSETRSGARVRGPPRTRGGSQPSTRIRSWAGSATGQPGPPTLGARYPRTSEPWNL
jgi:hypothetical protein